MPRSLSGFWTTLGVGCIGKVRRTADFSIILLMGFLRLDFSASDTTPSAGEVKSVPPLGEFMRYLGLMCCSQSNCRSILRRLASGHLSQMRKPWDCQQVVQFIHQA
jgi:hypothetical protein